LAELPDEEFIIGGLEEFPLDDVIGREDRMVRSASDNIILNLRLASCKKNVKL
jgi:hypothetical protein